MAFVVDVAAYILNHSLSFIGIKLILHLKIFGNFCSRHKMFFKNIFLHLLFFFIIYFLSIEGINIYKIFLCFPA